MDDEFVRHALGAVTVPETLLKSASAASKRVDIRTLKKKKRAKEAERTKIRNMSGRQLVNHLFDKFVKVNDNNEGEDGDEEEGEEALSTPASEEEEAQQDVKSEVKPEDKPEVNSTEEELKPESDRTKTAEAKVEEGSSGGETKPDADTVVGAEEVLKEEVESKEKADVDPVGSAVDEETQPAAHDVSKTEVSSKKENASDRNDEKSEENPEEKDESKATLQKDTKAPESEVKKKDSPAEDKEPEPSHETGKQSETVTDQERPAEKDQTEKGSGSKEPAREEGRKVAPKPSSSNRAVRSSWKENRPAFSHPDIERTAIITEEFKRKREVIRRQELAGEECDAMECFCREEEAKEAVDASAAVSESQGGYSVLSRVSRRRHEISHEIYTVVWLSLLNKRLKVLKFTAMKFHDTTE